MVQDNTIVKGKSQNDVMEMVNKKYSKIAEKYASGNMNADDCCSPDEVTNMDQNMVKTKAIPSFGCDQAIRGGLLSVAKPKEGECVVDLGSGPGKDSINSALMVGKTGKVIGVDFSDEMLNFARKNALEQKVDNIEFRKGNLLELPIEDNLVDLVISNCVINFVPDKSKVFQEAYRILKPGGRLVESDMVGLLPDEEHENLVVEDNTYISGGGGAISEERYVQQMKDAGFCKVEVKRLKEYTMDLGEIQVPYASSIFIGYKAI